MPSLKLRRPYSQLILGQGLMVPVDLSEFQSPLEMGYSLPLLPLVKSILVELVWCSVPANLLLFLEYLSDFLDLSSLLGRHFRSMTFLALKSWITGTTTTPLSQES